MLWLMVITSVVAFLSGPAFAAEENSHGISVPVYASSDVIGTIKAREDEQGRIVADISSLAAWVQNTLQKEYQEKFESVAGADQYRPLEDFESAGFRLSYDPLNAVFQISPVPAAIKNRSLQIQSFDKNDTQSMLEPAALSGFMNLRGGLDYIERSPYSTGRQPGRLDFDGALNMEGWVAEGRFDYLEDDDRPWQRQDTRLIHDWPEEMVRGALGDLSYPITEFQNYQRMAGVSLARNFDLQPYRVTQPSGATSFVLQSPSQVDVLINGQRVRTLQLEPGPYDISDFPLADGSNDVSLVITDSTGRVETLNFPVLTDQVLLKEGLHEYAYNIGIESDWYERDIHYSADKPVFSAFHRYGFSDELTAGLSAQADQDNQQAGFSVARALSWGTVSLDAAASHGGDYGADGAARVAYSFDDRADRSGISAFLRYRGENFTMLGQNGEADTPLWEGVIRYSKSFLNGINAGIGGRYGFYRDDDEQWAYNMNLSRVLSRSLTVHVSFEQNSEDGVGVFTGLTWVPFLSRHTLSTSIDTRSDTRDVRWDWRDERRWQVGAGATKQGDNVYGTGNLNYSGQRFQAGIRHDIRTALSSNSSSGSHTDETDSRSQLQAGAALAFADGHVALSSPISNSFIMVTPHPNLRGEEIGINPENDGPDDKEYQGEIDMFGPAVLPDATPYLERSVRIDTQSLPVGYDIGRDHYVSLPGYKSGTLLTVGNAANIYADGYLQMSDSTPVVLHAGMIEEIGKLGAQPQEFFTNEHGRFRISQMEPGIYKMTLHQYPGQSVTFQIPDDAPVGRYSAGTLILSGGGVE